jgi:hypothetical protein
MLKVCFHLKKRLLESNRRRASALVTLGGHDLVVPGTKVLVETSQLWDFSTSGTARRTYQSVRLPCVDVVLEGDGSAGTLGLANRDVLVESGSSLDRRGVGAGSLVNVVHSAVGCDLYQQVSDYIDTPAERRHLTVPR